MTFAEIDQVAISDQWKKFWKAVNCMVCLPFLYVETISIEKSEFVPSHHVFTQWLLTNTQVPAQGINVYSSINAYEINDARLASPGAAALLNTRGHRMVTKAFVIGSYFWYVHSLSSF